MTATRRRLSDSWSIAILSRLSPFQDNAPRRGAGPSDFSIGFCSRDGECERGTRSLILGRPQTPVVPLDNRAADREADPHPVRLGGIEGLEQTLAVFRREAHPGVLHGHAHPAFIAPGTHHQLPRAV